MAYLKYKQSQEVIVQKAGWTVQGWEGGGQCRPMAEALDGLGAVYQERKGSRKCYFGTFSVPRSCAGCNSFLQQYQ